MGEFPRESVGADVLRNHQPRTVERPQGADDSVPVPVTAAFQQLAGLRHVVLHSPCVRLQLVFELTGRPSAVAYEEAKETLDGIALIHIIDYGVKISADPQPRSIFPSVGDNAVAESVDKKQPVLAERASAIDSYGTLVRYALEKLW